MPLGKTGVTKICICGASFYVTRNRANTAKYCSKTCFDIDQSTRDRKNILCEGCGNAFIAAKDHGKWPKFCSRECFLSTCVRPEIVECHSCGDMFLAKALRSEYSIKGQLQKYCSNKCRTEGLKKTINVNCAACGKPLNISPSRKSKHREEKFCSWECYKKYCTHTNSARWKGGEYIDTTEGDIRVYCPRDGMVGKYLGKHRIIAARVIGRFLKHSEPILHIDRDKKNNGEENLYICHDLTEFHRIRLGIDLWPSASNLSVYGKVTPPSAS